MEPTFKWELRSVICKPVFTDKYGNVRTDVIKNIILAYVGTLEDRVEQAFLTGSLNLIDLSDFVVITNFTNQQIIDMALNSKNPKEIEQVENSVKNRFLQS
jgi:capsular polysaccharide biosynthesis protein